jgi:GNAT superfamily N-acetyltransferase
VIRQATTDDLKDVGAILGAAFQNDPISSWLFPEPDRRAAVQPAFFQVFATLALEVGGAVYVTDALTAATVWFPSAEAEDDDDAGVGDLFDSLTPDEAGRIGELFALMAANHPTRGAHRHLQFIGVRPEHHGTGVGGELLRHNLAVVDGTGLPAYLEASSTLSPPLYQRHGFEHIGTPFGPEPGPKMYPMWREVAR